MTYFNPKVFRELTDLQVNKGYTPTVIINLQSKESIQLLVNPSTIDETATNNVIVVDTYLREQVWLKNNKSPTYKFTGILLNTYRLNKSLERHLGDLKEILESKSLFSVVIGKKVISPLIFTQISINDSLRISGETTVCSVELQALKVSIENKVDKGLNR